VNSSLFKKSSLLDFGLLGKFCLLALTILFSVLIHAQDTRTVTEPIFPSICTTLYAQLPANLSGVDQTLDASYDTTRIQNAINGCTSGGAVELAANGTNVAFLSGALQLLKTNVPLVIDAGVTLYASRRPADFDEGAGLCGKIDNGGSNCNAFIRASNKSGTGIYGYGVIDGQGGQPMITPNPWYCYSGAPTKNCYGYTWWQLADYANTLNNMDQNNPRLINVTGVTNFVLYKVTLQNSPKFHAYLGGNGITLWGVKITAPWTSRNTDGFDPTGATNVTMTNSYVSTGDDNVAIKAATSSSSMTFSHNHFYAGHGMSVGSETNGSLNNVQVTDLVMAGNTADTNQNGLRIKSDSSRGGLVQNVVYDGVCIKDTDHPLVFDPYYSSSTGTLYPNFKSITVRNTHIVNDPSFSYLSSSQNIVMDGYSATYPLGLMLDNVTLDQPTSQGHFKVQYAGITLGPGPVSFSANISAATPGTGVTVTNNVSNSNAPYDCANKFVYLAGELFSSSNSSSASTITASQALPLNVIVQPIISGDPLPVGSVDILDGGNVVASVALSTTGWLTPFSLNGLTVGTHTLTAHFSGDAVTTKYTAMDFGSLMVTVNPDPVPTTTVLSSDTATADSGVAVTLTATVSASNGTPTGAVSFYDGVSLLGSASLNGVGQATYQTNTLGMGQHTMTASYAGDGSFAASSSTNQVTVNIAAAAPVLTALDFSPKQVDTSGVPAAIPVMVTAADNSSGVAASSIVVKFRSPSGATTISAGPFALYSGNSLNGTYQGTVIVPQNSEAGVWTVSEVDLADVAANQTVYDTVALQSLGVPTQLLVNLDVRSQVAVRLGDFDGDHRADLTWHNDADGSTIVWQTDNLAIAGYLLGWTVADTNWHPVANVDLDGDGKSDLLWHNASTGANYAWITSGGWFNGYGLETVADPNWQIVGTGDFDGDHKDDILWRNSQTGANTIWFMNGGTLTAANGIQGVDSQDWQVIAVADFNGDGKADILWRNLANGTVVVWFMDGRNLVSAGSPGTVADLNWSIAAVADFDGDHKAEILWRNRNTGANYMWMLNNDGTLANGASMQWVIDSNWQLAATGDLDGDGKADLVWRNTSNGNNYVWFMNGPTLVSSGPLEPVTAQSWKLY
jgi:polygalacturonase